MRAPLAVALRREAAIAAALSAQRQTLAATLIQGGLLDRRTERSTTERRAILDAAADRCARRIDELTRSQRTIAGDQQLVFAVLLG
jgi:hypothetical protein